MLLTIEETIQRIEEGKLLFLAGDESLLRQLPKGKWIGGTIPYFMDVNGGVCTNGKVFVTQPPEIIQEGTIKWYDESNLEQIPADAPDNGFSVVIIPATSSVHGSYAENAPKYKGIFLKPIIGWIAGVHLNDVGTITPKVFNGDKTEASDSKAIVMHLTLPPEKMASIGIVNLFKQGDGDTITFEKGGFIIDECLINGEKRNFAEYLLANDINTQLPLVADYNGAMVNVSFQNIDEEEKSVDLYAPVFKHVEYKIASPVADYISEFLELVPKNLNNIMFSCNCILNYLYSELEGKKTGNMIGPVTFGEVAYQLLNQTMVYLNVQ